MDKKLLEALNNLSLALEAVSEVLKESNESKKSQSATTTTMASGDFGVQLKEISADLKQIKSDTQELLKRQRTISSMQKQKGDEKSMFEKVGSDKKTESSMKKGLGTIILIAVAVLAIGMAFKLVGKIDFLSVISLGIAIVLISKAFKEVAELKLSLREAGMASLSMVMMSAAVTASSWILSLIKPITIPKLMTGIAISAMFAVMAPKMAMLIKTMTPVAQASIPGTGGLLSAKVGGAGFGTMGKVLLMLLGLSAVITASSWILRGMAILTPFQMVTGVAITSMFYVAGPKFAEMAKKATGILGFGGISWMAILKVKVLLVGMAVAIVAASHILRGVHLLTPFQMITSIAITAMFWMMGNFMPKLALSVIAVSKFMTRKDLAFLPILMVAMSTAVMLSSHILALSSPLSFMQMITTALITGLFWLMAQFLPRVAASVVAVDKLLKGKKNIFLIPLVFLAMAVAIAGAGLLFSKTPAMSWKQMISVLVIGLIFAGLAYVMPEMAVGIYIMEKKVGKNKIFLIPLIFVALAVAIYASAVILEKMPTIGLMTSLRILAFSVVMAISLIVVGAVAIFLTKKLGVINALKAVIIFAALSTAVFLSSKILKQGDYNSYPPWKWSLNTALALGVFAGLMILIAKMKLGTKDIIKGALAGVLLAGVIFAVSRILAKGTYKNEPGHKWSLNTALAILVIGGAMIGLGYLMMADGGLSLMLGTVGLSLVGLNIVLFAKVISKGKYDISKVPSTQWLKNVALALLLFGGAVIGLGMLLITGVGAVAMLAGAAALWGVAKMIVKTAEVLGKGKYEGGPSSSWVRATGMALRTFSGVIMDTGFSIVMSLGAGGVAIKSGIEATLNIADSIQKASHTLALGNYKAGPTATWARGVAIAMKAFWPIYEMLIDSKAWYSGFLGTSGITPKTFSDSIGIVIGGIVSAAKLLMEQPDIWKMGPSEEWARGVSISMKAFWPIYEMLIDSQAWYSGFTGTSGIDPAKFKVAIGTIVEGIVAAADAFAAKKGIQWKHGPTYEWAKGVGKAVKAFAPVYTALVESNKIWSRPVTAEQLSKAVRSISWAIVAAAKIFADNTAGFEEGNYPSAEWGKNVGKAIKAFVPVFTAISEQSGIFTGAQEVVDGLVYGIHTVTGAIVDVARSLKFAADDGVDWSAYPSKEWSRGVFESVTAYVLCSVELLDSGYSVENDFTITVAYKIVKLAKQFYWGKKYFEPTEADKFLASADVATSKYLKITFKVAKTFNSYNDQSTQQFANSMISFAAKFHKHRNVFSTRIDPRFMTNMYPNVIKYLEMVRKINSEQAGLKGLIKGAVFGDPVSRMADGMIKLAGAYDKMATSLSRFARSLAMIDEKRLQTFKNVNQEMLNKGGQIKQNEGFFSQVSSGMGNLAGAVLNRVTNFVSPKASKREGAAAQAAAKQAQPPKGKHGFSQHQLDKIIDALSELVANTKSLESFIQEQRNSDDDT